MSDLDHEDRIIRLTGYLLDHYPEQRPIIDSVDVAIRLLGEKCTSPDQAPGYVHAILDAYLTGAPLDFRGQPVPVDVQRRLGSGTRPASGPGQSGRAFLAHAHGFDCGLRPCARCSQLPPDPPVLLPSGPC